MRILHIGKYFPPIAGGMERFLGDLVRAQQAAGDEVSVLVHAGKGQRAPSDDPPWLMRCPVFIRLLFTPISPMFPLWLRRAILRNNPDVLHLHMPNASVFWALLLKSAMLRPWVVHWHSDVEPSQIKTSLRLAYPFYGFFERAVLQRAEFIIVSSARYLEASEPLRPWRYKCRVVPLGVATERLPEIDRDRASRHWHSQGLRVLTVGRLTYYKGFDTLLQAVSGSTGMELIVAGEGEERPLLEKALAGLPGGASPVRLAGEVDDATLCELLASCDVFCLPSRERTEAFGVVLLEAMRYGKPLLVSDLAGSGVTWVAREGDNAMLIEPDDVDAWRAALSALAGDPGKRRQLGDRGFDRYRREFDIEAIARRVRDVYDLARSASDEDAAPEDATQARTPQAPHGSYLIVIPALNEAVSIESVIARAREHAGSDVVVIDDGSTDDTRSIALASGAAVLHAPLWQGAWGAIQTGLRYAVRHGYAGVVTMDADGQHEPDYLPQLIEAGKNADVVIAACPSRGSVLRHIAWRYFRSLTGFRFEDLTSGFRFYNMKACRLLAGPEATLLDYQDIGVLLLLRHANMRVTEVSVPMNPRRNGISRVFFSWWMVVIYMVETTLLCLARWNQYPRKNS